MFQIWFLPVLIVGTTVALSIPVGRYLAWVIDGGFKPPRWLAWCERRLDTGPQNWKQYAFALLLFNLVMFLFSFAILALQQYLPLNQLRDEGKDTTLAPTTVF